MTEEKESPIRKEINASARILRAYGIASGIVYGFCNAQNIPMQSLESILLFSPALANAGYQSHITYIASKRELDDELPEETKTQLDDLKKPKVVIDEKNNKVFVTQPLSQKTIDILLISTGCMFGAVIGGIQTALGYCAGYFLGKLTK